jgi:hypothetical protein
MAKPAEETQFKIVNRAPYLSSWNHLGTPVVRPPWIIWRGKKNHKVLMEGLE